MVKSVTRFIYNKNNQTKLTLLQETPKLNHPKSPYHLSLPQTRENIMMCLILYCLHFNPNIMAITTTKPAKRYTPAKLTSSN